MNKVKYRDMYDDYQGSKVVTYHVFSSRMRYGGWTIEEAITTPTQSQIKLKNKYDSHIVPEVPKPIPNFNYDEIIERAQKLQPHDQDEQDRLITELTALQVEAITKYLLSQKAGN